MERAGGEEAQAMREVREVERDLAMARPLLRMARQALHHEHLELIYLIDAFLKERA